MGWPVYVNMVVGAPLLFAHEVTALVNKDVEAWRALVASVGKTSEEADL